MAKCHAASGFRLWPVFSAAGFRRKLLEAVTCGATTSSRHRRKAPPPPPPPEKPRSKYGSDRLSDLLKADVSESGSDDSDPPPEMTKRKLEVLEQLQGVVRSLQPDDGVRRKEAAADVRRLAKDDADARETLAMLGAIPPLVGMLDDSGDDLDGRTAALYALLNLGIGNDLNKAAIVKAGAVHKMLNLIESGKSPPSVSEAIVANFLGLTALDANKPIIGASGAIPFLVQSFESPSNSQMRQDSLRALFNLSLNPSNLPFLIDAGAVQSLLAAIGDMEVTDRALSVLSNLVDAPEGRKAVTRSNDSFPILIDALGWADSPGCQEKAVYILMVMAHKAGGSDRAVMNQAGIVSALLELALVGTALAQRRASRALEILTAEKGKRKGKGLAGGASGHVAVSAPLMGSVGEGEGETEGGMSEERRAVREMVQQSLQSNMKRIVRRANLPQEEFEPSDRLWRLTVTATSKSLPF